MVRLKSIWNAVPRKRRRLLVWGLSLFLAYTVTGFLILPLVIRAVAARQLGKQLDRPVRIEKVRLNPFVLSLSVRGLLVQDKDGEPFLSWDEFYANFQLSSFFRKPWVFKEIRLVQPFVRAQMNKDYTLNFSDLLKKFSAPSSKPKPASKPLFLEVERLSIAGARASITDLTPRVPFHRIIGPVQVTLTKFHTDPASENPYSFSGTTDSGERFAWSGQFSLDPLRSTGELSLEDISLPKYAALYQDLVRFDITNGMVSLQSAYDLALTSSNAIATVTNASFLLQGLSVVDRATSASVLDVDTLRVRGVSADAAARSAAVNAVTISGARIDLRRGQDERINLVDLSSPAVDATNAPGGILILLEAATNAFAAFLGSTNLWSGTLGELEVTNTEVHYADLANRRPVELDLDQIAVIGRDLSNVPGSNQTATVSLRWNTNGLIHLDASVQIRPAAAEIKLSVHDLDLKPLDPYLERFVNVFIVGSKVNLEGQLALSPSTNPLPVVTFKGDLRLDDFAALDGVMSEDLVKWKSIQVCGIEAGLQPPDVAVKQVNLVDPFARVAIETNRAINLLSALRFDQTDPQPQSVAAATAPSPGVHKKSSLSHKFGGVLRELLAGGTNGLGGSLPRVTVEALTISNGTVQFFDRSTEPSVRASIQALTGTVTGLSSEQLRRADLNLSGVVDGTGPFEVTGKLNPLAKDAPTDLTLDLQTVDLVPASPYSGRFLGYRLERGKLGLQISYTVSEKQLKAKNLLVLDHFTLGEKVSSPEATHLPVRLAVALLKDRNGKIQLDVPIEGNLDDPKFHYGKVISEVIVNVITKLVTSPFSVLGAVFGGKGEEVSYQEFDPGRAELKPAHADKLEALINGLYERPGLQVEIEGSFDPVADADALRRNKLRAEFCRKKWAGLRQSERAQISASQVSLSADEYQAAVLVAYRAMLQTNPMTALTGPPGTARPAETRSGRTSPPARDTEEEKGATGLINRASPVPETPLAEMERALMATISVTADDLNQLALERSQHAQQKILESGKIEASRISLKAADAVTSANHTARVYFHLE